MLLFLAALLAAPNAVVVRPVANMHAAPSEDSAVVSQAIFGANTGVLEVQPGWVKIRTPDDYTGWVAEAGVLRSVEPYAVEGVRVESLFANLYREPDVTKHQPLMTLPYEACLEPVATRDERWMKVRLPGGAPAWVQRGDISSNRTPYGIPELIAFSRRFLGLPYLWGGTSTFGYDCSGFTQMLCRRRGIAIPRDAAPQARWEGMTAVDRTPLEPGDLLYFGASQERITHTGMYIGNGEFIHASTHERPVVQIGRVDDPYWAGLFVAARRPK